MQENISFLSDGLTLEGQLYPGSIDAGIVITHPHPLYGGDMYNNVVQAVARFFQRKGYSTLCFNFRGVGKSLGAYDKGRGEQNDVRAAIEYLQSQNITAVDLAGYSFGAWVNARLAVKDHLTCNMVMVSPPVALIEFKAIESIAGLKLVITGSEDEIAPKELIRKLLPTWNPDAAVEVIQGADHFYFGFNNELGNALNRHFE